MENKNARMVAENVPIRHPIIDVLPDTKQQAHKC